CAAHAVIITVVAIIARTIKINASLATQIASNLSRAALLLPSASELGKDELIARVEEVIQAQIKEQEIEVVNLDVTAVDWTSLIKRAVLRHPPFEAGDKEKGFRDAIVLETFAQLHQNLRVCPKTSGRITKFSEHEAD